MKKTILKALACFVLIGLLSGCSDEEIKPDDTFNNNTKDGVIRDDGGF